MALPSVFLDALKAVPTKDLEHLCTMSKLEYRGQKMTARMLLEVFEKGDELALRKIHTSIAPILLVGGLFPGVGLACNIIDAAFCFSLGLWLDFAIDVIAIALFEVPGVSGLKSISKGMMGLCKYVKIDAKAFWKILSKMKQCNTLREGKIHELFSLLLPLSNKACDLIIFDVQSVGKSIAHTNMFNWGPEVVAKVSKECEECGVKIVQNNKYTIKTPTAPNSYGLKLLKLTERRIK